MPSFGFMELLIISMIVLIISTTVLVPVACVTLLVVAMRNKGAYRQRK